MILVLSLPFHHITWHTDPLKPACVSLSSLCIVNHETSSLEQTSMPCASCVFTQCSGSATVLCFEGIKNYGAGQFAKCVPCIPTSYCKTCSFLWSLPADAVYESSVIQRSSQSRNSTIKYQKSEHDQFWNQVEALIEELVLYMRLPTWMSRAWLAASCSQFILHLFSSSEGVLLLHLG